MKLCNSDERTNCARYNSTKDCKIEIIEIAKGDTFQIYSEQNQMIFIIEGSLNLLSKKLNNKNIKEGELM
ncbi:MAG: hypothetical protein LBU83_07215, partial [Bacteroidales bacterium]|nr:hypothetical protein [Bacteroidales bacterium]